MDVQRRLWIVELALHAYQLEYDHPPACLTQLVPRYLPHLPLDPYTNRHLLYRVGSDTAVVYSTGPDQDDDGGAGLTWNGLFMEENGDIVLTDLFEK